MKRGIATGDIEISQNLAVRFVERAVGPKRSCKTMLRAKRLNGNQRRSKLDRRGGVKRLIGGLRRYGLSVESFYQYSLPSVNRRQLSVIGWLRLLRGWDCSLG